MGLAFGYTVLLCVFLASATSCVLQVSYKQKYKDWLLRSWFVNAVAKTQERKERVVKEICRKSYHMMGTVSSPILAVLDEANAKLAALGMLAMSLTILVVEQVRIRNSKVNAAFMELFGNCVRPDESAKKITGTFHIMFGTGITLLLFSKKTAEFGLNCMFLGDSAAAFAGVLLGGPKLGPKKTVAGFLGCFLTCTWLTSVLTEKCSVFTGFVCAVVEVLCGQVIKLDDNIVIPLTSAFVQGGFRDFLGQMQWYWALLRAK